MKIEILKLTDLKQYEKNAKKHPKFQIDILSKNIKRFGFTTPILIDKNNEIIAGHGRLEALKTLNFTEVPCVRMDNLTDDEVKALRIADNKVAELGEWDDELAIEEMRRLDIELQSLTGWDLDDLLEVDDKDDEIPALSEDPKSKLGDLYVLGRHRVLCGDSTKVEDMEKLMGDIKADIWVTDPPYNVSYEGATKDKLKIENDDMGDSEFLQFLTDAFIVAVNYIKSGGAFYIWHAESEGYNFRKACKEAGLQIRQCLIWVKNSMVMGRQDYQWKHEPCLYGWKSGSNHLWNSDRKQTTVLDFDKPTVNDIHPTMKPVELFSYQITNNTKGEDIVLDTFLGSGTSIIASEKTGRICYGMELDPRYVDAIVQRYVNYVDNPKVILNNEDITNLWKKTK